MATTKIGTDLTSPAPPPLHLDIVICNPAYGRSLISDECLRAANILPRSDRDFPYPTKPQRWALPLFQLPITLNRGGCYISVEAAGPSIPEVVFIPPSGLRTLAAQVIQKCVGQHGGMGGFATYLMGPLFEYLLANEPSSRTPVPANTAFITLTVSGPEAKLSDPGNTDPVLPSYLADLFDAQASATLFDNPKHWKDILWAQFFRSVSLGSCQGWSLPGSSQLSTKVAANEMTYECDTSLGAPSVVDCGNIEWGNMLGPDTDTISVGPGRATFLHKDTCYVAITASIALILTWAQIRVALSALMTTCVQNPFYSHPLGGRAFHAIPSTSHPPGEKEKGKRRKRDGVGLSGLNALPPHANVTTFRQSEQWRSTMDEMNSCTWKQVVRGFPVDECHAS